MGEQCKPFLFRKGSNFSMMMKAECFHALRRRDMSSNIFIISKCLNIKVRFLDCLLILHFPEMLFPIQEPVPDPKLNGLFSITQKLSAGEPFFKGRSTNREETVFI